MSPMQQSPECYELCKFLAKQQDTVVKVESIQPKSLRDHDVITEAVGDELVHIGHPEHSWEGMRNEKGMALAPGGGPAALTKDGKVSNEDNANKHLRLGVGYSWTNAEKIKRQGQNVRETVLNMLREDPMRDDKIKHVISLTDKGLKAAKAAKAEAMGAGK